MLAQNINSSNFNINKQNCIQPTFQNYSNFKANEIDKFEKERKNAKNRQNFSLAMSALLTILIGVSVALGIKQSSGMGLSKKELAKQLFKDNSDAIPLNNLYYSNEVNNFAQRVIDGIKNPKKWIDHGSYPIRRFIMHGPGGTGKTTLAKSLTKELNGEFIELNMATLDSEWKSVGLRNLNSSADLICETAGKNKSKTYIVFLDEADSILSVDKSINADEKNRLQNEFKKILTKFEKHNNIVVIAATNANLVAEKEGAAAIGEITIAGPLASRFSDAIKIDLPNSTQIRKKIAEAYKEHPDIMDVLKNEDSNELKLISEFLGDRTKTQNVCFRELASLTASAYKGGAEKLSIADLMEALKSKKSKFKYLGQDYNKLLDDLNLGDIVERLPEDIPNKDNKTLENILGQLIS